jgi:hypothetical protein
MKRATLVAGLLVTDVGLINQVVIYEKPQRS